jgi:Domain of unknown function (DUF4388)
MSIYGYLHTMSLADLLQWASLNKKSGVLEVERNKIAKRISFLDGRITACSSDDPSSRLGQFLLSRGMITQQQLRQALAHQERNGKNLGLIFQEMGVLTREEIEAQVADKAQENIFGLFDWPDAVFRFAQNAPHDPWQIEISLSVEDVLLRGLQRHDELQRTRRTFKHSGVVLQRTSRPAPAGMAANPIAQRVLESIDGERTLAEILLHAHASEFLVAKFLFTLFRAGIVSILEERQPDPEAQTILDTVELDSELPADGSAASANERIAESEETDRRVEMAMQSIAAGDFVEALNVLNAEYRSNPGDNRLRELVTKAEAGFLRNARSGDMQPNRVPVATPAAAEHAEANLLPTELFLLSTIDGHTNIQSLVWVAPMREVDVMLGLRRLVDAGVVQLVDPPETGTPKRGVPKVQWILNDPVGTKK